MSGCLPFRPMYIQTSELGLFGLPAVDQQPDIVNKIQMASVMIDQYCGRQDTDGNGSLVYSTYSERILLPSGRNVFRVAFRPLASVDVNVYNDLVASGSVSQPDKDGATQHYYTGFQPNTIHRSCSTTLSPLLSASGRYGYGRRSAQQVYPDLGYGANILQIAAFFGGPPQFTPIDIAMTDYDVKNGELWVPAGLYLSQYTEVVVTYNSGFNPKRMPQAIKDACQAAVRNLLSRGGGATGVTSLTVSRGGVGAVFSPMIIDSNIQMMLENYVTVRSY